jgi:hypothetical protein
MNFEHSILDSVKKKKIYSFVLRVRISGVVEAEHYTGATSFNARINNV